MTPLDRLFAEHQIADLVTRYAVLNDDGDFEGMAALFADDARFIRPSGGDPIVGRDAILASYQGRPPRISRHLITNIVVDLASESEAACRSTIVLYTAEPGALPADANKPALLGGFRDRLVKTADGWRFAEREGFLDLKID
jgi:uncharacterized protein (TIGR02246 family)